MKLVTAALVGLFLASLAPRARGEEGEEKERRVATDGTGFALETALAAMRRANPLWIGAASEVRAAEADALTAGHWSNPTLDVSYAQAVRRSSYDPVGTPAVGLTQFFDVAGTPAARRRSAEAEVRATAAERDGRRRELEWSVREAFVRLATAYERRRIRVGSLAELERAAGIVQARVGSGVAPRYDASRIRFAQAQARAEVGDAEADIVRARGELAVAVGPAASELVGAPKIDLAAIPPVAPLPSTAEALAGRRADVVAARARAESSSIDIGVARRSVFPGFGVRIGTGFGQSTGQLDLGVGIVVPLPLVERGQGSVPAAEARAEGSRYAANAVATAAVQRLAAAHAELSLRTANLDRFRSETAVVSDGMRAEAEAGYREARLSVLELVDAYDTIREARLRLVDLVEAALLAQAGYRRAMGADDSSP